MSAVLDALKTLSEAHGPHALAQAFASLQGRVRRLRKATDAKLGTLAQTYLEAMRIWDAEKQDGVSRSERLAHLERTLRAAWPQTRAWHVLCVACWDLGLEYFECAGGSECGRVKAHLPHTYGRACVCAKGAKFRAAPKPEPEDFRTAGKSKPMTRVGR